ncbi:MAG TPA: nitrous oxide reductase accessory protein NosL [Ignavibacteria bacterium]|mgnify:CR=1 FL=1|nr:nitrous oxide reductase accessory protein NosL [Ignavibacteria bacterium]HQY53196.1 nitrous oxide reductase accessory protein NosL [Ignavibacteria bacterium]HRB01217.1 nitrous oxide reductase accessory protein NosL [Ignavibacteria bacterium]
MKKNSLKNLYNNHLKLRSIIYIVICLTFTSCSKELSPINFGKDMCDHCKMTIVDKKFGGELVNDKGKAYKFDAIECMVEYEEEKRSDSENEIFTLYTSYTIDILNPGELIKSDDAIFVLSESIKSPMGGDLASYSNKTEAENFIKENGGELFDFKSLKEKFIKK